MLNEEASMMMAVSSTAPLLRNLSPRRGAESEVRFVRRAVFMLREAQLESALNSHHLQCFCSLQNNNNNYANRRTAWRRWIISVKIPIFRSPKRTRPPWKRRRRANNSQFQSASTKRIRFLLPQQQARMPEAVLQAPLLPERQPYGKSIRANHAQTATTPDDVDDERRDGPQTVRD